MLTRKQAVMAAAGAVSGLTAAGAVARSTGARAADSALATTTEFASNRPPRVRYVVPRGWFVRPAVAAEMSVPWPLMFAANHPIPFDEPVTGDWADTVVAFLPAGGAAVSLVAYDRLTPMSKWLLGDAARVLAESGIDVNGPMPQERRLPNRISWHDLKRSSDATSRIAHHVGWFDVERYTLGVQVWVDRDADSAVAASIASSIRRSS